MVRKWPHLLARNKQRDWNKDFHNAISASKRMLSEGQGSKAVNAEALTLPRTVMADFLNSEIGVSKQTLSTTDELVNAARTSQFSEQAVDQLERLLRDTDSRIYGRDSSFEDSILLDRFGEISSRFVEEKRSHRKSRLFNCGPAFNSWGSLILSATLSACIAATLQAEESASDEQRVGQPQVVDQSRGEDGRLAAQVQDLVLHPGQVLQLGEASFLAGDFAKAVYCYEVAHRYWPGNADVTYNLDRARDALARSQSGQDIGSQETAIKGKSSDSTNPFWYRLVPSYSLQLGGLLLFSLLGAATLIWGIARKDKRGWYGGAASMLLSLGAIGAIHLNSPERFYHRMGIASVPLTVREGMSQKSPPAFSPTILPGETLAVLRRTPNWTFVQHPVHGEGWVETDKLVFQFH